MNNTIIGLSVLSAILFIIICVLAYKVASTQNCPPQTVCPIPKTCPAPKPCPVDRGGGRGGGGDGGGDGGGRKKPPVEEEFGEVKIEIRTGDKFLAGTDSDIQIVFNSPVIQPLLLDNPNVNDFERNETNIFVFKNTFITKNLLKKGFQIKNLGSNDWYFKSIKIYFNDVLIRNETYNNWVTSDDAANFLPTL